MSPSIHPVAALIIALPLFLPHVSRAQEAGPPTEPEVDWRGKIEGDARKILKNYYNPALRHSDVMQSCRADKGENCYNGGDHEDQWCTSSQCHQPGDTEKFLARLAEASDSAPDDPIVFAHAVYAYARLSHLEEAGEMAGRCSYASWWCDLLSGMVHDRAGRVMEAQASFNAALPAADPALTSRLTAVAELLDHDDRSDYGKLRGRERRDFDRRFWWLTNPFWSISGNDRWTRHIRRRFELILHEQILEVTGNEHPYSHEVVVVRRGHEDSWSKLGMPAPRWTSIKAATYRFTPVSGIGGEIGDIRYELTARREDERYTPDNYGPVHQVPTQFARFLERDSMVVVVAARLDLVPLGPPRTVFLVSDGPGSYPVGLQPRVAGPRPVVEAAVAPVPMVASLEFLDRAGGAARSRVGLPALGTEGLVVSDPVLLTPDSLSLPNSRDEAVAAMMGTTTVETGAELAVYWEVYGLVRGQPLDFSISIEGVEEGFFTRVLRALRIRGDDQGPVVSWTEPASAPTHPMALGLDIAGLDNGDYVLKIGVTLLDGSTSTTTRSFTVARP
ncbi:MAG: hypothetical protein F4139_01065 [Gemmatimonadetes bacterium]|nr:hypothetical protein [Gemmatimonadota bacterium]MYH51519.1 hypothetical protein [Gemmatimonadota bacterium]MYK67795.1 hypothetical protein [Gemmatimonadota bacterium]